MSDRPPITRAVLLAAGRGTRLGALTAHRPKPMVPVQGVPVLEHLLVGMRRAGIEQFLVVVGYRGDVIREYFRGGERWRARIEYAEQPVPNGTGAALALARDFAGGEPVLASYGDILTAWRHYDALVSMYRDTDAAAIIGINLLPDPAAGAAVYREGARMLRVVEKPPPGTATGRWNVAGVSVYGPSVWPLLHNLPLSPRGEYELTDAISGLIASGQPVLACELRGFWSDVGTPEVLAQAERDFRREE